VLSHDVQESVQPPTGVRLNAQGDPLRRMRTGADHGTREARYLACGRSDPGPRSNACDVAPPIPCRHAPRRFDDRSDGPEPPSMSAEDCTAHQDSQPRNGSTGRFTSERAVSRNSASSDTLANRRRRWPERGKRPRLRRQDKSAAFGAAYVVGWIGQFTDVADALCWRSRRFSQRIQCSKRHRRGKCPDFRL